MQQNQIYIGHKISAPHPQYPKRQFFISNVTKIANEDVYGAIPKNSDDDFQFQSVSLNQKKLHQDDLNLITQIISYQSTHEKDNDNQEKLSGIVKIHEILDKTQSAENVLIMEQITQDLKQFLQTNFQKSQSIEILHQIARPIRFLHHNNIIHGNLKTNSFIQVGNTFKLFDLELNKTRAIQDSYIYQAPEVIEGKGKEKASDIWSLGCIFFEVLTKKTLFYQGLTKQKLLQIQKQEQLINQRIDELINNQILRDLLKDMLNPISSQRISIQQVYQKLSQFLEFQQEFCIKIKQQPHLLQDISKKIALIEKKQNNSFQSQTLVLDEILQQQKQMENKFQQEFENHQKLQTDSSKLIDKLYDFLQQTKSELLQYDPINQLSKRLVKFQQQQVQSNQDNYKNIESKIETMRNDYQKKLENIDQILHEEMNKLHPSLGNHQQIENLGNLLKQFLQNQRKFETFSISKSINFKIKSINKIHQRTQENINVNFDAFINNFSQFHSQFLQFSQQMDNFNTSLNSDKFKMQSKVLQQLKEISNKFLIEIEDQNDKVEFLAKQMILVNNQIKNCQTLVS